MDCQPPYTPLELHQFNPHSFEFGDRVVLPDGRTSMVSKTGYKHDWGTVLATMPLEGCTAKCRAPMMYSMGWTTILPLRSEGSSAIACRD